ncbi:MAG: hypothetical protein CL930_06230 [Deltaproteobacteria bacterium]|nr:hypothetical protein [Deltaproteobacteria bacterium]
MGWLHLRALFNPTSEGIIMVALGALMCRGLMPRRYRPLIAPFAISILWIWLDKVGEYAPHLAGLGFDGSWGLDGRWFLHLPMLFIGALVGLCLPNEGAGKRVGFWAMAAGIYVGPLLTGRNDLLWLSASVAAFMILLSSRASQQILGAGLLVANLILSTWMTGPRLERLQYGVWSHARSVRTLNQWDTAPSGLDNIVRAFTPAGTISIWTDKEATGTHAVTLDGDTMRTDNRAAGAEELAGHLAVLLAPNEEAVLVLGDNLGHALRGLDAHPTRLTQVAVPYPIAIQTIAKVDKVRHRLWLSPQNQLFGEHPAHLLHRTTNVSTVLEISGAPWNDSHNTSIDQRHIESIRRRMKTDGMYILVAHLKWWPEGSVAELAATINDSFPHVQLWLPPEGADSIIFVATESRPDFSSFADRFALARTSLDELGFPTAHSLAGSAAINQQEMSQWTRRQDAFPKANHLPATLFQQPVLHLGALPTLMEQSETSFAGEPTDLSAINEVRKARELLLTMLRDASKGKIEGAFAAARTLAGDHGAIGRNALQSLIEPHLRDGRTAMNRARPKRPDDPLWDDALRYATTAKMLAPKNKHPHTLLGDIALTRGLIPKALEHYQDALVIDATHVPALEGIARCARLQGDLVKAEQALRDNTRHAPRNWQTWHNLGVFLLEQGELKKALDAIEVAVGLAPNELAEPRLVLAQALLTADQPGAALLRAQQCTQIAPENGLSWFLRGRAHFALNRLDEAEDDFRKAVLTDADLLEARGGIGQIRAILGDYDAAIKAFKDVLERDPDNQAARENLRRLKELAPSAPQEAP